MTPVKEVMHLVRELLSVVPRGKRRLILAIALAVGASGASVALMGTSAWLLSRAAEMPPVLYLLVASTGVRFFGLSRGIFRYFERLVGHNIAFSMQSALRLRTYDSLSRTTLLGSRHGDLLSRVTSDVESIVDVVVRVVIPFCSAAVVILGFGLVTTIFSPLYAVITVAICVIAGIVVPWLAALANREADATAAPTRGELADHVREMSRCSTDLVAYGKAADYQATMAAIDDRLRLIEARSAWTRGIASGIQTFSAGLSAVIGLLIGSLAVVDGTLPARDVAVLVLTPLALHEVFADLTKATQTLTRARAALGRVLDVLDAPAVGKGDRVMSDDGAPELRVDATIGWPGAAPIMADVQLSVAPGESVALVGHSGLGKTTLAATIMGLIEPASGQIEVPGRVGYLAQDAHIFATSVRENIKIGNPGADDARIREAMSRAGLDLPLDRIVGEDGASLSGGEAQRVALARLLVADSPAELVILDEPTEHLDRETSTRLLDDLFAVFTSAGMLVITHDEELMARCDRIVRLESFEIPTSAR